jgi:hypothetical protein
VTHFAIKSHNLICLQSLYDTRAPLGYNYNEDIKVAIAYGNVSIFSYVYDKWCYAHIESDKITYEKALDLAKTNILFGDQIGYLLNEVFVNEYLGNIHHYDWKDYYDHGNPEYFDYVFKHILDTGEQVPRVPIDKRSGSS